MTAQRRLLRIGILTIGILCIMQAVLNISLWLACKFRKKKKHVLSFWKQFEPWHFQSYCVICFSSGRGFAITAHNFCFLPVHWKEDTDQFPFNSSMIAEVCQIDQFQQNSTESCPCCNKLLKRLLREYWSLHRERHLLLNRVTQPTRDYTGEGEESGSGFLEDHWE